MSQEVNRSESFWQDEIKVKRGMFIPVYISSLGLNSTGIQVPLHLSVPASDTLCIFCP